MVADSAQKRASDSKYLTDKETDKADGEANAFKLMDETKAKLAENMNTMETLFSKLSEESSAEPVALHWQEPQRFLRHRRVHLRGPEPLPSRRWWLTFMTVTLMACIVALVLTAVRARPSMLVP